MNRQIFPNEHIKDVLIAEIGDIAKNHPYLSFTLICSAIEFLGICLDSTSRWTDQGKSSTHFKNAIDQLFPVCYQTIKDKLYTELRCGMVHCQVCGTFQLAELKNFTGIYPYSDHIVKNSQILILDYFYKDFVEACNKIISMTFPATDKMKLPLISIHSLVI